MLSVFILVPILGAIFIALLPGSTTSARYRTIALIIALGVAIWNVFLGVKFDPMLHQMQFVEFIPWIGSLGLNYNLGLDGLSLTLIFLNSLLTAIAILASDKSISRPKFYYSMLLLLSAGAAGAFLAQNLLLFFLFYELEINSLIFLNCYLGRSKERLCSNEIFCSIQLFPAYWCWHHF